MVCQTNQCNPQNQLPFVLINYPLDLTPFIEITYRLKNQLPSALINYPFFFIQIVLIALIVLIVLIILIALIVLIVLIVSTHCTHWWIMLTYFIWMYIDPLILPVTTYYHHISSVGLSMSIPVFFHVPGSPRIPCKNEKKCIVLRACYDKWWHKSTSVVCIC